MHGLRADLRWRRVLTPRWILVHAILVVLVAAFLVLGRWQLGRAADGNLLSYGYAIQWPAFAVFAVWVWVAEMRKALRRAGTEDKAGTEDDDAVDRELAAVGDVTGSPRPARSARPASRPRRRRRNEAAYDDSDDPQLAAYNHYLAWLNAHPHASPADYPGLPASKELTS